MREKVVLIRNVSPEKYGGGESYQLMMSEMLNKYEFEPIIITSSERLLVEARRRKIKAIRAPFQKRQNWSGWRNILLPFYWIWQIRLLNWYKRIFKQIRPSVINIQSRDDWIAATIAGKKMEIKILWTDHMDFRSWVLQNINIGYKNIIGKKIMKCAGNVYKIIMISDYERKWFEKHTRKYNVGNIITIKNGVIDKYNQYKKFKGYDNSFCYVGRLVDYKGLGELIEAFDDVSRERDDIALNIYGDGPDRSKYEELAKDNKKIIFYGQTNEPLKAISESMVFVLPSYREGLSLSLVDAVMLGKAIIASDVDGNPEVVGEDAGLLVPARNKEALKKAIEVLLGDQQLAKKMGRNARLKYEREFDFEKIFKEEMLILYRDRGEEE